MNTMGEYNDEETYIWWHDVGQFEITKDNRGLLIVQIAQYGTELRTYLHYFV